MSLDLLIAFVLITTPPGDYYKFDKPELQRNEIIKLLALEMELLDERETNFFFNVQKDWNDFRSGFVSDINFLRRRHIELKDAPSLVDRYKFPSSDVLEDLIAFNRGYRQTVLAQQAINHLKYDEYAEVLKEIDEAYEAWDILRDGTKGYYYASVRRYALKRLRTKIGDEAYNIGAMPPIVPFWRFKRIE
jgi:hypothetical protein